MNEIISFVNPEFGSVRTTDIDGVPYFVGKDIAVILGYKNPQEAIRTHIDEADKGVSEILTPGGTQKVPVINESGLYSLILSSKMPKAREFKHWVTSEILPSIRKHGAYMTDEALHRAITEPDFLIKLATELKQEQEKRRQLESKIEQDRPKIVFADAVEVAKTSILVGDLAKILKQNGLNIGQNRLFERLRNEGYLIKGGERKNMPTQAAMEMKLFEVKESTVSNPDGTIRITKTTKVTGKGQQYFINRYLSDVSDNPTVE